METKRSVYKVLEKQVTPVLHVIEEVGVDKMELIQDELQATAYSDK